MEQMGASGEWIAWSSKGRRYNELPVERGVLVDVRYRDGGEQYGLPAGVDTGPNWRDAETRFWCQERHPSDIMFWRPAQVGRNPEGEDPQGLRAEHEHAVGEADAPGEGQ